MPWKIREEGDEFLVVTKDGKKIMGRHGSKSKARRQLAALYANEPSASQRKGGLAYSTVFKGVTERLGEMKARGNWGHAGRPGQRGGSAGRGPLSIRPDGDSLSTGSGGTPVKPSEMTPEAYASHLRGMSEDQRDNTDLYENTPGRTLYEAEKLMPKKEEDKFKKVTDRNSDMLWQDTEYVANVGGKPFLLNKQEDPDEPDEFPKVFVWSFAPATNATNTIYTHVSDDNELRQEIRNWQQKQ